MTPEILLLIVFVAVMLEGFFSGSEIALVSLDKIKLKQKLEAGNKIARLIVFFISKPSKLLSTTLLGTNLCVVTSTTAMTFFIIENYGSKYEFLTVLIMSPIILIFGEILPKIFYRSKKEILTEKIVFPLIIFHFLFFPVIFLISFLARLIAKNDDFVLKQLISKDDLKILISMENKNSDLKSHERKMIKEIFEFSNLTAKDVMIPLIDVCALENDSTIDEVIEIIEKERYSRIPVYSERIDNIIGLIYAYDLLNASKEEKETNRFIKPILYVPETQTAEFLLKEFQIKGINIAAVVDEYGGTIGICTLEDIIEEIVGDIEDEHDVTEQMYVKLSLNKYIINARMEIDKLNELLSISIPKKEYETVGGFILQLLKKIPEKDELFQFKNLEFQIKKVSKRSVEEVIITRK